MSRLIGIKIVPKFSPLGNGSCYYNLVAIREYRFLWWKWKDESVVGPPFHTKVAAKVAKNKMLGNESENKKHR